MFKNFAAGMTGLHCLFPSVSLTGQGSESQLPSEELIASGLVLVVCLAGPLLYLCTSCDLAVSDWLLKVCGIEGRWTREYRIKKQFLNIKEDGRGEGQGERRALLKNEKRDGTCVVGNVVELLVITQVVWRIEMCSTHGN